MTSRTYFLRQALTLIKFAQTTSDPQVSAALIAKADKLKSQIGEPADLSARAPDVEMAPDLERPPDPGEKES